MLFERMLAMGAIDRSANVFRSWRCDIGTDLFGTIVLSVMFGRTGTDGRTIIRAVPNQATAERMVRQLVARRASAKRRIGVGYRVTDSTASRRSAQIAE
jgi:hypothetical protein